MTYPVCTPSLSIRNSYPAAVSSFPPTEAEAWIVNCAHEHLDLSWLNINNHGNEQRRMYKVTVERENVRSGFIRNLELLEEILYDKLVSMFLRTDATTILL